MTIVTRFCVPVLVMMSLCGRASAQAPQPAAATPSGADFPVITFGVVSFLQYSADLHEADGFNAFDVTRGYFNVGVKFSDRLRARFTTNVRPTTDAELNSNLAIRLEYAYLEAPISSKASVKFGMQETPWLAFEESINRYRAQGTFFSEREGLIPGPSDLGASVDVTMRATEVQVGVYNGEGYGRAELDKYKTVQARATFRPYFNDSAKTSVKVSGFYSYGWYARDRPHNVAIVMGSYEHPHVVATAQYVAATDNPYIAADAKRRGMSFFGEGRQGQTGWAGLGRVDLFDPDASDNYDARRRVIVGGAHWSQVGRARFGVVGTLEQVARTIDSQLLERRLLVQTHVEF